KRPSPAFRASSTWRPKGLRGCRRCGKRWRNRPEEVRGRRGKSLPPSSSATGARTTIASRIVPRTGRLALPVFFSLAGGLTQHPLRIFPGAKPGACSGCRGLQSNGEAEWACRPPLDYPLDGDLSEFPAFG